MDLFHSFSILGVFGLYGAAWIRSNYVTGSPRMEEGHGRNISFTEMKEGVSTKHESHNDSQCNFCFQ